MFQMWIHGRRCQPSTLFNLFYSEGVKLIITSWGRQKKRIRGEFPRSRPIPRETSKNCPALISVNPEAQLLGTADRVNIGPNPGIWNCPP